MSHLQNVPRAMRTEVDALVEDAIERIATLTNSDPYAEKPTVENVVAFVVACNVAHRLLHEFPNPYSSSFSLLTDLAS